MRSRSEGKIQSATTMSELTAAVKEWIDVCPFHVRLPLDELTSKPMKAESIVNILKTMMTKEQVLKNRFDLTFSSDYKEITKLLLYEDVSASRVRKNGSYR